MQYEPIKKSVGRFFGNMPFMRKLLYRLLDLLLLRTWHVKKSLSRIFALLPDNVQILDAGAGFGQYSWRMARMNSSCNIRGIDINPSHVADCNDFFEKAGVSDRIRFNEGDLTKLDETDKYNLILSVDVMEHIEDDRRVFSNFHKALRKGGFLIISTPSDKGGSDVHDEGDASFIDEHVRDGYSIGDITEKLTTAGFSSVNAKYTYGLPGSISWRLSMKYPVKMLNYSYLFFIVLPFWYLLFFPFCLILNFFDLYSDHSSGTGLLVTATK